MKRLVSLSFFSFSALLHIEEQASAHENASPKLRLKAGGAAKKSDERSAHGAIDKEREKAKKDALRLTSRERIGKYARERQTFFVVSSAKDPAPFLFEDPSKEVIYGTSIWWLCAPSHAPDVNGDGQFDSLVAHVVSFTPNLAAFKDKGASVTGAYMTHGYTASWSEESGYYDEYIVDFDDTTVMHVKGSSFNFYETSPAGGKGGVVAVGAGEWIFDVEHPLLYEMAKEMGLEDSTLLTPDVCAEKYAEAWTENNKPPSESKSTIKENDLVGS
ncbi:hypothetical protein ACHAWF_007639 [Thalassiosira exigua]